MKKKALATFLISLSLCYLIRAQAVEDLDLTIPQLENRLLEWVNKERQRSGLNSLKIDPILSVIARNHSSKMASEKTLSHTFTSYASLSSRVADAGLYFNALAENVARGDTFVMRIVHKALMDSPGHRRNILSNEFSSIGIGIIYDNEFYYTTQIFAHVVTPKAPKYIENTLLVSLKKKLPSEYQDPIADVPEIQELCRNRATQFLAGNPDPNLPNTWIWGKAELVSHTFSENYQVIPKLMEEITRCPATWVLGVHFARTTLNPGGCYAVCLVKFPNLIHSHDMEKKMFDQLNSERVQVGHRSTIWFEPLAKGAEKLAHSYINKKSMPSLKKKYRFSFTYETHEINIIPERVFRGINRKTLKTMGINILYPLTHRPFKNTLIVAIVAN